MSNKKILICYFSHKKTPPRQEDTQDECVDSGEHCEPTVEDDVDFTLCFNSQQFDKQLQQVNHVEAKEKCFASPVSAEGLEEYQNKT